MSDSYLAHARAPIQLDIIADTALAMAAIRQPKRPMRDGSHSSTGTNEDDGSHSSTRLKRVDKRRRDLKISRQMLCSTAGIHLNTYRFGLEGHNNCQPRTLDKLEAALDRFEAGGQPPEQLTLCLYCLRNLIVDLAKRVGWDPELMLEQNFDAENSNDPVWLQASRLRRCAIYLLVEGLQLGKAKIGRAVGVSRQAIHKTVAAIEAERQNDERFNELMSSMMLLVKGIRL
jgi:hypothetical protein